jgi:curved DNA-binding protein CbpA
MVKLDYDRDYYADLELTAAADPAEVKKQFKKLGEFKIRQRDAL